MNLFKYITLLLIIFQASAQDANNPGEKVKSLIKILEEGGSKDRKKAKEDLLNMGPTIINELTSYLKSDDPELKATVKELIEKLRKKVKKNQPRRRIEPRRRVRRKVNNGKSMQQWTAFIHNKKAASLAEIITLSKKTDKDLQRDALEGMMIYLGLVHPIDTAKYLQTLNKEQRIEYSTRLSSVTLTTNGQRLAENLFFLHILLKNEKLAIRFGFIAWSYTRASKKRSQFIIDNLAIIIKKSSNPAAVWEIAGREVYKELSINKRILKVEFYSRIAAAVDAPGVMKVLAKIAPLNSGNFVTLLPLIKLHDKIDNQGFIQGLLSSKTEPASMYMLLRSYNRDNGINKLSDKDFKQIIDAATTEEKCHMLTNPILHYKDNDERLIECYNKIIALKPRKSNYDRVARLNLLRIYERTASFKKARSTVQELLDTIEFKDGQYHAVLKASLKTKLEYYQKIEDSYPEAYTKLINEGMVFLYAEKHDKALAKFAQAIKLKSDAPQAWLLSIEINGKRGNNANYISEIKKYLETKEVETYENLRRRTYKAVFILETDLARVYLGKLSSISPKTISTLIIQAQFFQRNGEVKKAIEIYERIPRYYRNNNLGLAYARAGDYKKAKVEFEKEVLLRPFARYDRIWLHLMKRMLNEKDTDIKEYIKYNTDEKDFSKSILQFVAGNISEEQLLKDANKNPDTWQIKGSLCEAYFYIGMMAKSMKKMDKANASFKKCLSYNIISFIEHTWAMYELGSFKKEKTP
ncbi:MAG: hypothetical protein HRT89_22080 [Lentisphaeria bacterium]|nr:hypothetical protein [Lentisphaeria bacterium]NQZ70751.1 hypothetical protein [Lentisphaeria bacterium]